MMKKSLETVPVWNIEIDEIGMKFLDWVYNEAISNVETTKKKDWDKGLESADEFRCWIINSTLTVFDRLGYKPSGMFCLDDVVRVFDLSQSGTWLHYKIFEQAAAMGFLDKYGRDYRLTEKGKEAYQAKYGRKP